MNEEKLITLKELLAITSTGRTLAYNKWNKNSKYYDPIFPTPVTKTGKLRFSHLEVQKYLQTITQKARAPALQSSVTS